MNFDELKALAISKGIDENLDAIHAEAIKYISAKTTDQKVIDEYAVARVHNALKKQLASNAESYEGIFYGLDRINDYNKKEHAKMIAKWNESDEAQRNTMVEAGFFNGKGQPLSQSGFNKGEPIKATASRKCFGMLKTGEHIIMNMYESKMNVLPPLCVPVKFRANCSGHMSEDGRKYLSSASVTNFKVCGDEIPMPELMAHYLGHIKMSTNSLSVADINKIVAIDDFAIIDVMAPRKEGSNGVLKISANDCDLNSAIPTITCWMPPTVELPSVDVQGAALIGKVGLDKNNPEALNIQVMGFWIPPMFRMEHKPEPITTKPEEVEEVW